MSTNKSKKIANKEASEEAIVPITKLPHKQPVEFKISEEGKKIIEEFKEYLIKNRKVTTTIKSYIFDVNSFVEFIESTDIAFTGEFNISQYNDFIKKQSEQNFKPNTINKRINSLQQFNTFLLSAKYMSGVIIILKNDKLPINNMK